MQVVFKPNSFWRDARGLSFEEEIVITRGLTPQFQLGGGAEAAAEAADQLGTIANLVNIANLSFTALV